MMSKDLDTLWKTYARVRSFTNLPHTSTKEAKKKKKTDDSSEDDSGGSDTDSWLILVCIPFLPYHIIA